jgi:hypothetical protein
MIRVGFGLSLEFLAQDSFLVQAFHLHDQAVLND